MATATHSRKPSIITAIFILIAGIFIGGYLVLKSGRGTAGQLEDILMGRSIIGGVCEPNTADAQKDSDDDGLKDWEEVQIYNTEPCKPDSDGDGYLDGEEVASGYYPNKKAPGDEMPGTNTAKARPLPQNLTEALRQQLSEQIKNNKIQAFDASGQLLSEDQIAAYPGLQNSISEAISNGAAYFAPDEISESQIKTTSDNSQQSIQKYAAAVVKALPDPPKTVDYSDDQLFLSAISGGDLSELHNCRESYKEAYENLKKITVPSNIVSLHIRQMQIISSMIKIYGGIEMINIDPLKANIALLAYETVSENTNKWLSDLSEFIKDIK